MTYPSRLLALSLLLAACGPDKGGTAGDTTTDTAGDTTATTAAPTGCELPEPPFDDCICAPGCGEFQCIDDAWSCECVSCGETDPGTSTDPTTGPATTGPTGTSTTGLVPCSEPLPPFDECICAPGCGEFQCIDDVWSCECVDCGGTDTDPGTSTGGDTDTTGGLDIDCTANPPVFPPFHNPPCMTDDECAVGLHQIDCCGTFEAWGIAAADADAFAAAEATCEAQFPVCECPMQPTKADDGKVGDGPNAFAAICKDNTCQSIVP